MPIFVARLTDGSTVIGEAADPRDARERFCGEEGTAHGEEIATLRELPANVFCSRWYLNVNATDLEELDCPDGSLSQEIRWDLIEHEYPLIHAAHQSAGTGGNEEPFADPSLPRTTPLVHPGNVAQMNKWKENLIARLRQAAQLELERCRSK
jgi:hypothetical protein